MVGQMSYTTNFAYPTGNPNMLTGINSNRSRLDSGTSGSSESSRGSGKPPRRRSHRPRGCRGGSNRRRNNSSDSTIKNGGNKCGNKGQNNHKGKTDNKTATTKNQKRTGPSYKHGGPPMQEFTILGRQPKENTGFYVDCKPATFQRQNSAASQISLSTAPMTDYSSSLGSCDASSFGHANGLYDFNTIQPSFSDSSSDFPSDARMFVHPTRSFQNNKIDNQILPPLPTQAFHHNHNEHIPSGPNPYALKLVARENNYQPDFRKSYNHQNKSLPMVDSKNFEGGYATPIKPFATPIHPTQLHRFESAQYSSNLMPPPPSRQQCFGSRNNANNENDYRAARLEIQRQNVEGGSLFATSPRSFLMGKRTEVVAVTTGGGGGGGGGPAN